ncbi:MAG TPA: HAMP domain-containing sensor histidine kinase, partial [Flavobacteriales bacterium]|nr:HAMP domain-containing sensor histidine kinase [Flavobacteriales bacterium]
GDAHWTTQILQALISNASKFSPRGSSISINAGATADGSAITVSDKGTGFTGSDLVDVFTRYAILSSRTTAGEPQARGTLARAKQWARAQGGHLNVESEGPGQGARFTLTLPPAQSLLGIS